MGQTNWAVSGKTSITGVISGEQGNIYTFGWLKSPNFATEFPFITKLNACGEKLWCRMFAMEGYSFGSFTDAIIIENGDLLCLAYMPEDDPSNNNRILIFSVSTDGEFLWKKDMPPMKIINTMEILKE